jgi:hypothetical protein
VLFLLQTVAKSRKDVFHVHALYTKHAPWWRHVNAAALQLLCGKYSVQYADMNSWRCKEEIRGANDSPCMRVRPRVSYQTLLTPLGNRDDAPWARPEVRGQAMPFTSTPFYYSSTDSLVLRLCYENTRRLPYAFIACNVLKPNNPPTNQNDEDGVPRKRKTMFLGRLTHSCVRNA